MKEKRPLEFIRADLFSVTQAQFAVISGASQTAVCRWESGKQEPSREQMAAIRNAAIERGLLWNDEWFFIVPASISRDAPPFREASSTPANEAEEAGVAL